MKDLILLHGAIGSSAQLTALSIALKDVFSVHSFNFDGHGGEAIDGPYSIDRFLENLIHYLDENKLDQVVIFGYSMGGYVALKAAAKHPNRIVSISTLGTKFNWTPETAAKEVKMLDAEKIEEKVPKFAEHLKLVHSPLDWKEVLKGTAEMMLHLGEGKGLTDDEISSISIPVLIGIGEQDQMVSIDESKRVTNLLPNGKMIVFEDFQHPLEKIDLRVLATSISQFHNP
jgi:pimeloyl-ACP methyl ester carboxylesterase